MSTKASITFKLAVVAFPVAPSDFTLVPVTPDATRRWLSPIHSPPWAGDSLHSILRI